MPNSKLDCNVFLGIVVSLLLRDYRRKHHHNTFYLAIWDRMKRYMLASQLTSAQRGEGKPVGGAAVLMSSHWSVCAYVLGGIQGKLDEGEGLH